MDSCLYSVQVIHIKIQVTFVCNEFRPRYISSFCAAKVRVEGTGEWGWGGGGWRSD